MAHIYQKVLIVGGGIGGLAGAVALSDAGCQVDLIEIQNDWTGSGVGIIQPSNALRALDSLGVAEACLQNGYPYNSYRWFKADGTLITDAPGPRVAEHLPAYNGITRGLLHDILLERAISAGVNIMLGTTIKTLQQNECSAEVTLSNGISADYSMIVGADGIYSDLRKRLFGQLEPHATGQSAWRITMPRPEEVKWGAMIVGPTSKAGLIPLSEDEMYLLLVTEENPKEFLPPQELATLLLDRLDPFGGIINDLRKYIDDPEKVVYRPMQIVMLPKPWHVGRVLLIGDAAHASTPHLGQGAAMAIEDVVVLGELIGKQLPWQQVVEEYMARRFQRASMIQSASFEIGEYELGRRPDLNVLTLIENTKTEAAKAI